jgi:two-component system chemotaxis response regulator CheB
MPANALRAAAVDFCVPLAEIGPLLARLVQSGNTRRREADVPKEIAIEAAIAAGDVQALSDMRSFGTPSMFTCPDCHGTLMEIRDSRPARFRCHTGHAFSQESLRAALDERIEDALWNTVRTLQERAMLMSHFARHARENGDLGIAEQWEKEAADAKSKAERVRRVQAE